MSPSSGPASPAWPAPGYFFLATDTPPLLRWLAGRAVAAGAQLRFSTPVRSARLGVNTRFLRGAEAEFTGVRGVHPDRLHCFLDSRLAPGYIAWVVPGVHGVQVGLACDPTHGPDLDACVRRLHRVFDFSSARRESPESRP